MEDKKTKITYRDAGVDIDAGEKAVDLIRDMAKSTFTPQVLSGLGGFSGLYGLKGIIGDDPVLVSGTDGVGTKLKIAFMTGKNDTVGIDAVAMCVNDVICTGAVPLFFLDYIGTGRLQPGQIADVVSGIAEGCRRAGCALVGGEMAEMPGFYDDGEYDIAGFCVGLVDRSKIIDGSKISAGDVLIGIPSSGLHSNGFSLVRKVVFDAAGKNINDKVPEVDNKSVGEVLLEPTELYAKAINSLVAGVEVKGIANITGGGLEGNVSRIIPGGLKISVDWDSFKRPGVFDYIQRLGEVEEEEMRRVFNLGIGMVVIVDPSKAEKTIEIIRENGYDSKVIGHVE
ncbi:MAG TPA: phosphoribosylformylglycinamidine cyclo-ligase [bacterium]|nr:phosphoribosylformylglycinamidine cyclo-ligase [bacterium]